MRKPDALYNYSMIVTKAEPFSSQEIEQVKEQFETYIKTVIDLQKKICSAGADRHFESEQLLLGQGSAQQDLWGGGIDLETGMIDSNSFINIRPNQGNTSNEIQNPEIRQMFEELMKFFFGEIL